MLFNSVNFLLFFPVVVLLYYAVPHAARHYWLLAASYYFYMSWNPKYALLMALSTGITYASGLLIGREAEIEGLPGEAAAGTGLAAGPAQAGPAQAAIRRARFRKRLWVFLSMASNLAILFFFKYFDFFIANLNRVLGAAGIALVDPAFDVILPVGISFYTFQALSYTMDVYRGEIYVEKSFVKYALFVSFFPQLVAGPIERSKNLLVQISRRHKLEWRRTVDGLLLMLWGFFLKLVIADRAAILVNTVYGDPAAYPGLTLAVATIAFGIQIYCDFGSYSAIAIGSAQVMGFRLMDNFRQPYFSRSIGEFWRRWHISLSTWFRDYLYIPLGGGRKGTLRKYANVMVVFLVSGLWHGANWTFVIWGFLHGAFQVIGQITRPGKEWLTDRLGIDRDAASYKLGQMLVTFLLVNFAWIFFRAESFTGARAVVKGLFSQWDPWVFTDGSLYLLGLSAHSLWAGVVAVLVLVGVSAAQYNGIRLRERFARQGWLFQVLVTLGLLMAVLVFGIYGPGYAASQFIYFQF